MTSLNRRLLPMLVLGVFLLAACTSPAPQTPSGQPGATQAPRRGGVLRFAELGGAPRILHPYPDQNLQGWNDAATLIWAGLIDFDYDALDYTIDPRTSMATALPQITNNGRTFTFTLRDDLKWSDGRPITSADFQFAWDNASKEENDWVGYTGLVERVESFRTPDPRTVQVTLKEQLARFLAMGLAAGIAPVPRHIWEGKPWLDPQGNPEILKPTVVSGPYMPKDLSPEGHSYIRNPNWWGAPPNLDEIVFVSASNPTATLELLRTRQVEWAHEFPPSLFDDARRIPTANVLDWTPAAGGYRAMDFNLARPPLSDKRFREALARTVNRGDLVQFDDDLAVPQYGLFTEASRWRSDAVERYDFDMNRSRQLLQGAGFRLDAGVLRDPTGQPVRLEIIYPTTSIPRSKIATYLQQQWKELGIEAAVTGLEFSTFADRQLRKDFDVVMSGWGSTLDPDSARTMFKTGGTQNSVGYSNPKIDQLFEVGAAEQDERRRKEIYDEIQRVILDDLPSLPLTTTKRFTAVDKSVVGVFPRKGDDIFRDNSNQFMEWYLTQ